MEKNKGIKTENIWPTIKKIFRDVLDYKGLLIITLLCVVASTLTQIQAVAMVQPIIDDYILKANLEGLTSVIIKLSLIYLISFLTSIIYVRVMVRISEHVTEDLRNRLFKKIQKLPVSYFDRTNHGEVMSRFTNDIDLVDQALGNSLTNLFQSIMLFVGIVAMMIYMNIRLFLVTLVFLAGMMIFTRFIIGRSARYYGTQQKRLGNLNGFIEEMLQGQKVVKVFNYEDKAIEKYENNNNDLRKAGKKATVNAGLLMPVLNNLSNIDYAVTCIVGAVMAIYGNLSIGTLAVFLTYCRQIQRPIGMVAQQSNVILQAVAGAKRVYEIIELEDEDDTGSVELVRCKIDENSNITESGENTGRWAWRKKENGNVEYQRFCGNIEFKNVNFSYNGKDMILKDISFNAYEGQKIAFVGSTGAGKTTITNLITRFYDIDSGEILIDGINIYDIKKSSLRSTFGMVLQDTSVFTETIRDNIRYGRLDATDEEIEAASKVANAKSFIDRLPEGFDTVIKAGESSLSEGQLQLVSIARAAVAEPAMLILDEATSSIDSQTESLVTDAMDNLMMGRTTLVIAHRLSTIKNSDMIMVMDNGRIIERGNHDELISKGGRYYELYTGKIELD